MFWSPCGSTRWRASTSSPYKALDEHALIQAIQADDDSMLGPNKLFEADLVEEDDSGMLAEIGRKVKFFVVDFADDILAFCRDYDTAADDVETFVGLGCFRWWRFGSGGFLVGSRGASTRFQGGNLEEGCPKEGHHCRSARDWRLWRCNSSSLPRLVASSPHLPRHMGDSQPH